MNEVEYLRQKCEKQEARIRELEALCHKLRPVLDWAITHQAAKKKTPSFSLFNLGK